MSNYPKEANYGLRRPMCVCFQSRGNGSYGNNMPCYNSEIFVKNVGYGFMLSRSNPI